MESYARILHYVYPGGSTHQLEIDNQTCPGSFSVYVLRALFVVFTNKTDKCAKSNTNNSLVRGFRLGSSGSYQLWPSLTLQGCFTGLVGLPAVVTSSALLIFPLYICQQSVCANHEVLSSCVSCFPASLLGFTLGQSQLSLALSLWTIKGAGGPVTMGNKPPPLRVLVPIQFSIQSHRYHFRVAFRSWVLIPQALGKERM